LTGLNLISDICHGKLEGGRVGSSEIKFYPGTIQSGEYLGDIGTAG
jgi:RNA 3'-terminal phosphate cyclase (ATP)